MRKEHPLVVLGSFKLLYPEHPQLMIFERQYEGEKWLVAVNLTEETVHFEHLEEVAEETIITNYKGTDYQLKDLCFRPYEAFVVKCVSSH